MGKIAIEGMQFYAYHGFYEAEQALGGHFRVDIYLTTDFSDAANTDELSGTVDYELVYQLTREVMEQPSKLIEHVANRILSRIMAQFEAVTEAVVRVSKLNPPVKGLTDRVYVELTAER